MSRPEAALSILVLTEDSAHDAVPTVRELARIFLRLIDAGCVLSRVDLEPADEQTQQAMHGNLWKGKKAGGYQKLVDLARTVATKILTPRGFVFVHVDADRVWGERQKRTSENFDKFREKVELQVERLVADQLAKRGRQGEVSEVMSRLLLLAPYRSIEAWLLQNTSVARALCHKHYQGRDADLFTRWEQDRAALDELPDPKRATCLGARHNRALAELSSFPAAAVDAVGKSFSATAACIRACAPLCAALATTRPGGASPSRTDP